MMFMEEEEYLKELKKIGRNLDKLLGEVNNQLREMNAGFFIGVQGEMHSFDEWPTEELRPLIEEFVSSEKALGIPIAGLKGLLAELYYQEREERKKKAKK